MTTQYDTLLSQSLSLTEEERAMLADRLCESLTEKTAREIELAWIEEAERRLQEIEQGKAMSLSAEIVFREVRASLKK